MKAKSFVPHLVVVSAFAITSLSCGFNFYEQLEDTDPIEQAIIFLEQGKPKQALDILQPELNARPDDREVLSLMGSAKAQLHGFEPLGYALALSLPTGEGQNNVTKTFSALPEATDENIVGLQDASDYVLTISEERRTATDRFKLAMFNSAMMALISKKFSDDDGELTAESLANMTPEEALLILSSLDNAEAVLQSGVIDGQNSNAAANQVSNIKNAIENQEGSSDLEKVQNYLESR